MCFRRSPFPPAQRSVRGHVDASDPDGRSRQPVRGTVGEAVWTYRPDSDRTGTISLATPMKGFYWVLSEENWNLISKPTVCPL